MNVIEQYVIEPTDRTNQNIFYLKRTHISDSQQGRNNKRRIDVKNTLIIAFILPIMLLRIYHIYRCMSIIVLRYSVA